MNDTDDTGNPTTEFLRFNPSMTYREAKLYCDRRGVLGLGTHLPDGMLPIAAAPWLPLWIAASGLALHEEGGPALLVPGVPEAGDDSEAALDAVMAFRTKIEAALERPMDARRNAS